MSNLQIKDIIKDNNTFAVVSHTSPDGDSMGSILALYNVLIQNNKTVAVIVDDKLPDVFSYMPNYGMIRGVEAVSSYDCVFALDCGDPARLGRGKELLPLAKIVVNIDHHVSNNMYGDINLVDNNASSTGEVLFEIFKGCNYKIDKDTATCLYTSILTDTGCFKYSNTSSKALKITGELIDTGISFSEIYSYIYDRKTLKQVRLMSRVLETLDMQLENRVAILTLFPEMLEEAGAFEEDASEFINIARDIDTVEVAVFIKKKSNNLFKISLRAKSKADVRLIAEKFKGGGHIRAAGCSIEGEYSEVKATLVRELKLQMDGDM